MRWASAESKRSSVAPSTRRPRPLRRHRAPSTSRRVSTLAGLALLAIAIAALYVSADRARTFAVCSVNRGRLTIVRGKLPARVRSELEEVVARGGVASASFSIKREDGRPTLVLHALDDANVAQRLRNVVGRFSVAELR